MRAAVLAALALMATAAGAAKTPALAEVVRVDDMRRGVHITPAQCAATPNTVWVQVASGGHCIRYYVSTSGGQGDVPVVWLSGDKLGRYNFRTRSFEGAPNQRDVPTEMLQRKADNLSKQAGTTVIYLARPGLDGSSGFHGYRRSWLELYVLNAALDEIRKRHGYRGFHLAGQSGGAGLVVGLVIIRSDIACAVPGAGPLALRRTRQHPDRLHEHFNPVREAPLIARRTQTRLIVVTDPQDQVAAGEQQHEFVRAVRGAGGRVEHFLVQAADEKRHAVAVYTRRAVALCVRGAPGETIAAELNTLQERHLAAARERRERSRSATTTAQPGDRRPASRPPEGPVPDRFHFAPTRELYRGLV
jgi:pimeloyl-ACP methyl ester carboxylesterase